MNCNSFFSGYYNSTRDLNLEASGGSFWHDKISTVGYNCNGIFSFSYPDQHLGYYKEALKSMMLNHEAIFKNQIHELHRVYWRQKELMVEMKVTSLNPVFSGNLYENLPGTVHTTSLPWMNPCYHSYINGSKTSESPDVNSEQVGSNHHNGRKKFVKLLDLELPAHEYLDIEEEKFSEEEKGCKVPEVLDYSSRKIFGFQIKIDKELSPGRILACSSDSIKTKCLLDLNEPIKIQETGDSKSNHFAAPIAGFQVPSNQIEKSQESSHPEKEKAQAVSFSKDNEAGTGLDLNTSPEDSCEEKASVLKKPQESFLVSFCGKRERERSSVVVQALPCFNGFFASSRKCPKSWIKSSCSKKKSKAGVNIDAASEDDDSSLKTCFVAKTDLEAPVSPENKESARPTMESDNNQASLEKENLDCSRGLESVQAQAKPENKERYLGVEEDEPKRIAAEIIVDISSSCVQTLLENLAYEPKKLSFRGNLDWFAGIASSVSEDSKSEFGLSLCYCDKRSSPDEMDYFEAMTLQLTETKEKEHCTKSKNVNLEMMGSALVHGSLRRGRSRRGRKQHKDFQNEILPSLASLSRNEVTDDLQTIGGLMEASGKKRENGSSGNRTEIAILSRKGRSYGSSPKVTETIVSSCDKIEVRKAIDWGMITRRRRGPRSAAANFQLNHGQA